MQLFSTRLKTTKTAPPKCAQTIKGVDPDSIFTTWNNFNSRYYPNFVLNDLERIAGRYSEGGNLSKKDSLCHAWEFLDYSIQLNAIKQLIELTARETAKIRTKEELPTMAPEYIKSYRLAIYNQHYRRAVVKFMNKFTSVNSWEDPRTNSGVLVSLYNLLKFNH